MSGVITRFVPGIEMIRNYDRSALRPDLVAAATVTALLIPSGLAYGELAGLSPVTGLYTGLIAMLAYAMLGSSRVLIVGPESQIAILVSAALLPLAASGERYAALAGTLALLTGLVCLVGWVLRVGFLADYLSQSVLVGYLTGVALIIIVNQVAKLVGASTSGDTLVDQVTGLWDSRSEADLASLAIGLVSLLVLLLLKRLAPKVPASLVTVIGMTAASAILNLGDQGVSVVGDIIRGLPLPALPVVGLGDTINLLWPATGLALVVFANSVLTGRAYAARDKGDGVDADQELLALAGANVSAGLLHGFAIGASDSRTAVNYASGGRTQMVGVFAAGFTALFLIAFAPLVADLPSPTLAAIVIVAALGIVRPSDWRALADFRRFALLLALVTLVGVAVLGILQGILLAVFINMLELIYTLSRPRVVALAPAGNRGRWRASTPQDAAEVAPDVLAVRYDGPLFFASSDHMQRRVRGLAGQRSSQVRALVLNLEAVSYVDLNGATALLQLVDHVHDAGLILALARVRADIRGPLTRAGVIDAIGEEHIYDRVEDAVTDLSEFWPPPERAGSR